jgi:hypothetical protein
VPLFLTIVLMVLGAFGFGTFVSVDRLADSLQPMITAASIMAAAVLVRLNRGMPSLDWKSIAPSKRQDITAGIVAITREYAVIIAALSVLLFLALGLLITGKATLITLEPRSAKTLVMIFGALAGLCIGRMGYVVWRDYDIVRLQKVIVDDAAVKEQTAENAAAAASKIDVMKEARSPGVNT